MLVMSGFSPKAMGQVATPETREPQPVQSSPAPSPAVTQGNLQSGKLSSSLNSSPSIASQPLFDFKDSDTVVGYGQTGRVKLTTLTKEFFVPGFLERDEALRTPPVPAYPCDGVADVRQFKKLHVNVVEGVYRFSTSTSSAAAGSNG